MNARVTVRLHDFTVGYVDLASTTVPMELLNVEKHGDLVFVLDDLPHINKTVTAVGCDGDKGRALIVDGHARRLELHVTKEEE